MTSFVNECSSIRAPIVGWRPDCHAKINEDIRQSFILVDATS